MQNSVRNCQKWGLTASLKDGGPRRPQIRLP